MILHVRVKPNSSKDEIVKFSSDRYFVYLKAAPKNNEANMQLIKMLSRYLGIPHTSIAIKHGFSDRDKLIEIK